MENLERVAMLAAERLGTILNQKNQIGEIQERLDKALADNRGLIESAYTAGIGAVGGYLVDNHEEELCGEEAIQRMCLKILEQHPYERG